MSLSSLQLTYSGSWKQLNGNAITVSIADIRCVLQFTIVDRENFMMLSLICSSREYHCNHTSIAESSMPGKYESCFWQFLAANRQGY